MITSKEMKLIVELRKNGRENITDLAKKHDFPKSTMYDLLHRMEKEGIIEHRSIVDFQKLGFPLQVFFVVKTTTQHKEKLKKYLTEKKNINSIYTVNHGFNFHFMGVFRNQKDVEDFLEELENDYPLTQINVYTVIETIATEKFLSEEEHFA